MAFRFGRHDVDAFLHEIDGEQYDEWGLFFGEEPTGWQADSLMASHTAFWLAQVRSPKRLNPKHFELKVARPVPLSPETQKVRGEAQSIKARVAARLAARVKERRRGR